MYSKKYRIEKIEEFGRHNELYDDVEGTVCYLAYLNVGERGWFLFEGKDWFSTPHRIHTSLIKDVEYIDNLVIATTEHTRFTFKLIEKGSDAAVSV